MLVKLDDSNRERVRRVVTKFKSVYGKGSKPYQFEQRLLGFGGELAVSLILRQKWNAELTTRGDVADVGWTVQVRTATQPRADSMLIRPGDLERYPNTPYVFVKAYSDALFDVIGWLNSDEVTKVGTFNVGGDRTRKPCWFVRQNFLNLDLTPLKAVPKMTV